MSLLIIRDALFGGVTRYSEFQENLGIATNVRKPGSTDLGRLTAR